MSKVTRIRTWLWAAVAALAAVGAVYATPDWDPQNYSLSRKHVVFSIQYHVLTEAERQYYKSMLAELDEFADSLKQSGKLGLGKVSFKILLDDWNPEIPASVEMSRSKGGYNCALNTHYTAKAGITVDRGYLARIIAYFASDGWESLVCEDCYDDGARSVAALRLFHRRLAPIAAALGDSARAEKEMRSIEAERVRLERERKEAERERVKKEE